MMPNEYYSHVSEIKINNGENSVNRVKGGRLQVTTNELFSNHNTG